MGYDLHITRRKDWADESGPEITAEEWLSYIATDRSLRLDKDAEAFPMYTDAVRGPSSGRPL